MPVSHEKKTIFIHIPKNAGESIERTLGMYAGNPKETLWGILDGRIVLHHMTALQTKMLLSKESVWNQYFKFAVVRNPWSKAVSEYNWYLRYGPRCSFKEWAQTLERRISLNRFINILEIGHNIEQREFVFDHNGNSLLDCIIRFENLREEFDILSKSKGWDVDLIHAETTSSGNKSEDFRTKYDSETIEIVEKIYVKDIKIFGYSKDETFG